MNTTVRRILFYFFIFVFVILGAYLLLTAQGLVFDSKNLKFVKTGALFLRFNPSDALLNLNGKPEEISQGFVLPGVLITDLKPGAYHLVLHKDGYTPWEKDLPVQSGIVTAATHVELWPQQFALTEVAKDPISDFWITQSGAVTSDTNHVLHLDGTVLRGKDVVISDKDSSYLVTKDEKNYFFTDLQNPASSTNLSQLFSSLSARVPNSIKPEPITNVLLHPFSAGKLLVTTSDKLYLLDTKRVRLDLLVTLPNIAAVATSDNEALLLDSRGKLLIFNLLLQTTNEYLLDITDVAEIKTSPGGNDVFLLQKNGDLSDYDRGSRTTSLLAHNVDSFSLSPGEERMAIITNDGSLHILALKDYHSDIDVVEGAQWNIILPSSLGTPQKFFWFDSFPNYGLVSGTHGAMLAELDSRTPQNTSLISGDIEKIIPDGTTLYAMKNDGSFVETTIGE